MKIDRLERPALPPVTGLCDVKNSLLGENGATAVYGPQKGVAGEEIVTLDRSLARVAGLVADFTGEDFRDAEGSGAAGGLGFGLLSFCGAVLEPGFEALARVVAIEEKIRKADLVVTGEGGMDRQTLEGKTAYGVARIARRLDRTVAAFVGRLEDRELLLENFDQIIPLVGGDVSSEQALREASILLEAAAFRFHA
jgi:glycerate kinase